MPTPPKREAELTRPRSRRGGDQAPTVHGTRREASIPNIPKDWHPVARRMFNALKESGQADFYQSSDWAFAYTVCDDLSRYKFAEDRHLAAAERREAWYEMTEDEREQAGMDRKKAPSVPREGSAMKLTAAMDALARLGVTEADRLRVRIELTAPSDPDADAEVIAINEYKKALGVAK